MINQDTLTLTIEILQSIVRIYSVFIVFPLLLIILSRRLIQEKQKTGTYNRIRIIILSIFVTVFWLETWEFLGYQVPFVSLELSGFEAEDFSFYNFGLGLAVSLGILLATYTYKLKYFYFTSLYMFFGLFILFLYTGTSLILMPYIYVCAITSLVFLFYIGFKLKDSGALGVGIYFLLSFLTLFTPEEGILALSDIIMSFAYLNFGLLFGLGYFKPFKPKTKKEFRGN